MGIPRMALQTPHRTRRKIAASSRKVKRAILQIRKLRTLSKICDLKLGIEYAAYVRDTGTSMKQDQ